MTSPLLQSIEDQLATAKSSEQLRRIKERLRPQTAQLSEKERRELNALYAFKRSALLHFGDFR